ncbi:MAG: hypothetical protein ACRDVM_02170, partial [Acidimicrobiia bacterium]
LMVLADRLLGVIADLPPPFRVAVDFLRATGLAGMVGVTLVGAPAVWALRRTGERWAWWMDEAEIPLLYFVWAIGAMVFHVAG